MLELAGVAVRLPGDSYVRAVADAVVACPGSDDRASDGSGGLIQLFMDFVRVHNHGISRKYLQKYLAGHWCHRDRHSWGAGSLLLACLRSGPVSCRQILEYVSSPLVRVLPSF